MHTPHASLPVSTAHDPPVVGVPLSPTVAGRPESGALEPASVTVPGPIVVDEEQLTTKTPTANTALEVIEGSEPVKFEIICSFFP